MQFYMFGIFLVSIIQISQQNIKQQKNQYDLVQTINSHKNINIKSKIYQQYFVLFSLNSEDSTLFFNFLNGLFCNQHFQNNSHHIIHFQKFVYSNNNTKTMTKQSGVEYLGLCIRIQPPLIGVYYKNKGKDQKKKIYTILLQRLVLNPNVDQIVDQLYREHPHILKQDKIPKVRIERLVSKIQQELNVGDEEYDNQQFQEQEPQVQKAEKKLPPRRNFQFDQSEESGNPALNRSM